MSEQTYQLGFAILPGPEHPERETHGEGFAVCWIISTSQEDAEATARAALAEERWQILEAEGGGPVTASDFPPDEKGQVDENLAYFQEAQTEREVFLFHLSPRFPVYQVALRVQTTEEGNRVQATCHYFRAGETLLEEDESLFSGDFWTPARVAAVEARARALVAEATWEVAALETSRPVGYSELAGELQPYYDHAEGDGECFLFLHEGNQAEG